MSGQRTLVVDVRAKAPVWRVPESFERDLVASAPAGWRVVIVPTDTVSDGDGGHPPAREVLAALADAEAYFAFGVTDHHLQAAPRLKWVHTAAAGVGSTLTPRMRASGIILTNSAGVHAVPMAEYALAGLLYFWRSIDLAQPARASGEWARDPFIGEGSPVREAGENTVLIVGTGGIGTALATRLTALGARCVGIRRHPERGAPPGFERVAGADALDALLAETDALVLSAPATPGTQGLIDARRLDLLKRHAVVVNVARGTLLDEAALAERLRSGRLRGAVLDVFQREPLAPESALWQLRRALVTPHVSAVSPRRFWEREGALFRENWRRYSAGQPLRNVVDKDAGY